MKIEDKDKMRIYLSANDYYGAKQFLESIKENNLEYWYMHARVSRKLGDLDIAKESCEKALKISPTNRGVKFELGLIYQYEGKFEEAIEKMKQAASSEDGEVYTDEQIDILNSLGLTYKKMGNFVNAQNFYGQALHVICLSAYENIRRNGFVDMSMEYASLLDGMWMEMALKIAHEASVEDGFKDLKYTSPDTSKSLFEAGSIAGAPFHDDGYTRHLLPGYFSAFFLALKTNLHYANVLNNIGVIHAVQGNVEQARKYYKESIKFIPTEVSFKPPYDNLKELDILTYLENDGGINSDQKN